jgi:hypothetical protein
MNFPHQCVLYGVEAVKFGLSVPVPALRSVGLLSRALAFDGAFA